MGCKLSTIDVLRGLKALILLYYNVRLYDSKSTYATWNFKITHNRSDWRDYVEPKSSEACIDGCFSAIGTVIIPLLLLL